MRSEDGDEEEQAGSSCDFYKVEYWKRLAAERSAPLRRLSSAFEVVTYWEVPWDDDVKTNPTPRHDQEAERRLVARVYRNRTLSPHREWWLTGAVSDEAHEMLSRGAPYAFCAMLTDGDTRVPIVAAAACFSTQPLVTVTFGEGSDTFQARVAGGPITLSGAIPGSSRAPLLNFTTVDRCGRKKTSETKNLPP